MKIKHKLLIAFGILVFLSFFIVLVNFVTFQTMERDAQFVNEAGRLRATSFRMAQLANIVYYTDGKDNIEKLQASINMFDEILLNVSKNIEHIPTEERVFSIKDRWILEFKPAYESIITGEDVEALNLINREVAEYVSTINDMVTGYSDYSSSKVSSAKVTNSLLSLLTLIMGVISFLFLNRGIRKPIKLLIDDLKDLSDGNGDLTKRIENNSKDEIGEMTNYFNSFISSIHSIVIEISGISNSLSDNMNSISNTTEELTKSTEMIASSSMEVAEGSVVQNQKLKALNNLVDTLKADIGSVSQKSNQTLRASELSQESVLQGNNQVNVQADKLDEFVIAIDEASSTVEQLNKSSEEIKAIVDLIHSISSQTNLLALNASIEAARAGEAGRGFAVVAEEIRKLAEETSTSAGRISNIVLTIGDRTQNVKSAMDGLVEKTEIQKVSMDALRKELKKILERTALTLTKSQEILSISSKVNDEFLNITDSAIEIQGVAIQNSNNTQEVASAVEEQTASFEEVSANMSAINEKAEELTRIVGRFKI